MTTRNMNTPSKSTIVLFASLMPLLMAGCSDSGSDSNPTHANRIEGSLESKVGISAVQGSGTSTVRKASAIRLTHRARSQTEVLQHAALLAEVLVGKERGALRSAPPALAASASKGSTHFDVDGNPHIKAHYKDSHDELGVINEDVTHDYDAPNDIGEKAAESRFTVAFETLANRGAFDRGEMDLSNVRRSRIMQAEGTNTGVSQPPRVKEYEFTVTRKLKGVPVFESGTTVSVHRSGALARIRVFGASAAAESVADVSSDARPVIAQAQVDRRVMADYANHQVKQLGLQYWLPRDRALTAAKSTQPRYLYAVYPQLPAMQNGKHLVGKGSIVAYPAVEGDTEPLLVWPPSTASSPGDQK